MHGTATPPRTALHRPLLSPLRTTLTTALLATVIWTSPVFAQQAEDPNARATARYEAGQAAAKQEQWQEAYGAFREAWALRRHPQIALNLGRAALKVGQPKEAAERLSYFLREVKDLAPADKQQVEVLLVDARRKVGSLTIGVNRQDAEYFVDGEAVGKGARTEEVFVDPGEHQVEVRVAGGETARAEVEAMAGTRQHVGLWVTGAGGALTTTGPAISTYSTQSSGISDAKPYLVGAGILGTVAAAGLGATFTILSNTRAEERGAAPTIGGGAASPEGSASIDRWNGLERGRIDLANGAFYSFVAAGALGLGTLGVVLFAPGHSGQEAPVKVEARSNGIVVRGAW